MTAAKVWDGSQWMTVTDLVGPQGPQGPAGLGTVPSGAAGGGLSGTYPNPGVKKDVAGGLLDVQRIWGLNPAYRGILTGESFKVDAAGTVPLAVSYTPTVPVWWEVEASIGILQKLDGNYHYSYLILSLSPADADGKNARQMIEQQHASVQTYVFRNATQWWKLNAGTPYTCTALIATGGGTWQYHQDKSYLWMSGRVFPQ